MKNCTSILMVTCCVLMAGCGGGANKAGSPKLDTNRINAALVSSYNDLAMQNAVIAQHTLYPYHFVKNGAELNELGQRDLAVLAGHFKEYPGQLNVRRDDLSAEIYSARVDHTLDLLKKAGVDAQRISVSDGMPGGSGMTSERVLTILAAAEGQDSKTTESATYTTGTGVQQ